MASNLRLGQISAISFTSKLLSSAVGFAATLYIARAIGAEPLGTYYLALALVSWVSLAGHIGISGAISKRVSEGEEQGSYASSGAAVIMALFLVLAAGLVILRQQVNEYIGFPATVFVILLVLVYLAEAIINPILSGLKLVHVRDILSGVRVSSRSGFQIALVYVGFGTVGLFIGHIAAFLIAIVVGTFVISRNLVGFGRPRKRHITSLLDFAKYSWLGNLRGRMLTYTDIIVLGFFVSQSLIGVYSVAWNISRFLSIFSDSIRATLFPAMSEISTTQDPQAVGDMFEQSLTYGGLFVIPALFGGAVLGERLLKFYGPEFPQGATILTILIVASLIRSYQLQFLNVLNGVNRPDLAFHVNGGFIVSNLVLNVVLVFLYGWIGAAVATAVSVAVSLALAYRHVNSIIEFDLPLSELAKQWVAAGFMGVLLIGVLYVEGTTDVIGHNFALVLLMVSLGAGFYFLVLLTISSEFRHTVRQNVAVL